MWTTSKTETHWVLFFLFFSRTSTFQLLDKPWSQVSSLSPPRFLPSIFSTHRVQQSHCSSIFHRVLLTHTLALSVSQFVHKKKFQRMYTSMHSAGLEVTKLTYTRLEDNLIRHRGDRDQPRRAKTNLRSTTICAKTNLSHPPPRHRSLPPTPHSISYSTSKWLVPTTGVDALTTTPG